MPSDDKSIVKGEEEDGKVGTRPVPNISDSTTGSENDQEKDIVKKKQD